MIIYGSVADPVQIHLAFDPARPTEKEFLLKQGENYKKLSIQEVLTQYANIKV
jgi:tryptophanase